MRPVPRVGRKPRRLSVTRPSQAASSEAKWATPGRLQRHTAAVAIPSGGEAYA